MANLGELRVPGELRRGACSDEDASIEAAVWLIQHMCEHLGLDDLGSSEVLDFGCGVRFTQALIKYSLPIKRYVGIDVYREMVHYLRENVDDPRIEYFHVDAHNARYNPKGEILTEDTKLPLDGRTFDVICLFSVFTHLAPHDYRTLLKVLRRHIKPDGKLFYTLYLDELTEGGRGLMDALAKRLNAGDARLIEPFRDLDSQRPLRWAVYSEHYARELIEGTGWQVASLSPPDVHIQHHFVCTPR